MRDVTVQAPASKSMSHRALIAAALAPGESLVSGLLDSQDIRRTRACLAACGAAFEERADGLAVHGLPDGPRGGTADSPADMNVGESGTTCRLLAGVLASGKGFFRVHGEGRMHDRPIGEVFRALAGQNVSVRYERKEGYPPLVLGTDGLPGGELSISMEESSQYLSGLLLAAPLAKGPCVLGVGGSKVVSWPYVALTLQVMEDFGVPAKVELLTNGAWISAIHGRPVSAEPGKIRFQVRPGTYRARSYAVEGDWSNSSYFLAAGALGPNAVRVVGLRPDSLQGDRAILDILGRMGAQVSWDGGAARVAPATDGLRGADLDMGQCPDLVPTVAVAASMARGVTTIRNVAHLRIKESDRLAALATEITRAGGGAELLSDGIRVTPGELAAGREVSFLTYGDHRMAMSLSLFALAGIRPVLDNPGCVAKSFPGFFGQWEPLAAAAGEAGRD
ncbi:3-phosphoshikimate 1-carboxyvinyltransferase [Desulfovibrio aminophilus]|uniref:3-phosphoshikimate 1-carboxyvinyltransferase n=1 Tax=Desulfovibrio aminophilus TaxID=81425 RepID=UPI003393FAF6